MRGATSLTLLLLCLAISSFAKPIYDFKSSYVTQLTNFNFKDQVTKIRQNTNYVAVVHFYKYNGRHSIRQMANLFPSLRILIIGLISTMGSLGLEPLIAINIVSFAPMRVSLFSLHSKFILLPLFLPRLSLYIFPHLGRFFC